MASFPIMHNLILIMQNHHQLNSEWGTVHSMTGQYSLKCHGYKRQGKSEGLTQIWKRQNMEVGCRIQNRKWNVTIPHIPFFWSRNKALLEHWWNPNMSCTLVTCIVPRPLLSFDHCLVLQRMLMLRGELSEGHLRILFYFHNSSRNLKLPQSKELTIFIEGIPKTLTKWKTILNS